MYFQSEEEYPDWNLKEIEVWNQHLEELSEIAINEAYDKYLKSNRTTREELSKDSIYQTFDEFKDWWKKLDEETKYYAIEVWEKIIFSF